MKKEKEKEKMKKEEEEEEEEKEEGEEEEEEEEVEEEKEKLRVGLLLPATDIWWFPILTSKSLVFRWIDGFPVGTDLTLVQSLTVSSSSGRIVVAHINFSKSGVQVD
ncbi:hypothetical protein RRG08_002427 [Elysia crispata]|uniref:Uncharacterized protein n=1 Tax=Elysia crispata TaxID=231223 RepID=A0AAE1E2V2_9GAST|nr:hypothetical protein RRG08_002427 [Elysia crispata]